MADRPTWTQPLCEACYQAFLLGQGKTPREPTRVVNAGEERCCVCGERTNVYVRIDPKLTGGLRLARREAASRG